MKHYPPHLVHVMNGFNRLKRSSDNMDGKNVAQTNRDVQNNIVGQYCSLGSNENSNERSSVRATNVANGHKVVQRDKSSTDVIHPINCVDMSDENSFIEEISVLNENGKKRTERDNNLRKKSSKKKSKVVHVEEKIDDTKHSTSKMASVIDKMADIQYNVFKGDIQKDRLSFEKKLHEDKQEYMNEKIKLQTERFTFEKTEMKWLLLKEVRDDAMKEYRHETDENLKPFLLEAYKKSHEAYIEQLNNMM